MTKTGNRNDQCVRVIEEPSEDREGWGLNLEKLNEEVRNIRYHSNRIRVHKRAFDAI